MNHSIITLPSEQLLADAQSIFGSLLVTGAWFTSDDGTFSRAVQAVRDYDSWHEEDPLSIALPTHGVILLEFSNGRKVLFGSSEWAHISLLQQHITEVTQITTPK